MTLRSPQDPTWSLPLTHVAYHILLALANRNLHGYGIIKLVSEQTHGRVDLEAGTLYAAIKRMRDDGWIEQAPTSPGEDSRRRTYAIADLGRQVLQAESERLQAMVELAREADVLPQAGA